MSATLLLASGDGAIVFAVFMVFVIVAAVVSMFRSSRRNDNLEAAARRFQGTVVSSFWTGKGIEFVVDGIPAALTFESGRRNEETRVRFGFTPPGRLRIAPEGLFASLRKAFGAQDIEFGEAAFDRAFLVQGSPEAWVREVLNEEARRRINRLTEIGWSFSRGSYVCVDAGPGGVTIFCRTCFVDNRKDLDAFLDLGIEIFRHIRTPAVEGIKILSGEEHAVRGECPVCATALDAAARRCPTCGTPHHRDCWDYFGGCAIYACARRGGRS